MLWSRDQGLDTWVHSSSFFTGLGLGLEISNKVLTTTLLIFGHRCVSWGSSRRSPRPPKCDPLQLTSVVLVPDCGAYKLWSPYTQGPKLILKRSTWDRLAVVITGFKASLLSELDFLKRERRSWCLQSVWPAEWEWTAGSDWVSPRFTVDTELRRKLRTADACLPRDTPTACSRQATEFGRLADELQ